MNNSNWQKTHPTGFLDVLASSTSCCGSNSIYFLLSLSGLSRKTTKNTKCVSWTQWNTLRQTKFKIFPEQLRRIYKKNDNSNFHFAFRFELIVARQKWLFSFSHHFPHESVFFYCENDISKHSYAVKWLLVTISPSPTHKKTYVFGISVHFGLKKMWMEFRHSKPLRVKESSNGLSSHLVKIKNCPQHWVIWAPGGRSQIEWSPVLGR